MFFVCRRFQLFTSVSFAAFLAAAFILYSISPRKLRPALLLILSYLFCAGLNVKSLVALILATLFTYFAALWIEKTDERKHPVWRKLLTILSIAACVLILTGCKYMARFQISIPIGLSFYLFQSVSYLADVSLGKFSARTNFVHFGLYLAYFPKFVSGPIERWDSFTEQLQNLDTARLWNRGRLSAAVTYMLYGYFMKLVMADRLSLIVDRLFDAPANFDSLWLIIGAFFYTIQIYCDFAGYSFIAVGCSLLFGISLTQNFLSPYFSKNITEFWRRWHISLSSFLRDYVYIPLGGNRKGLFRKCLNTLIVFAICGIWHGSGLNFLAWGLLHGFYAVLDSLLKKAKIRIPFSQFFTFLAVAFAWIFFKATSLRSALFYILNLFTLGYQPEKFVSGLEPLNMIGIDLAVLIVGILMVAAADILSYIKQEPFPALVQHSGHIVRYALFYVLIILMFLFGVYGPGYQPEQFIYMQF